MRILVERLHGCCIVYWDVALAYLKYAFKQLGHSPTSEEV